jgi:protoporphyrin/coproporphyrin ferrochelatase
VAHPTKPGLLLINLGTPDAPRAPEVRRYLRQFLSDPRVVDISPLGRWFLLNFVILPFRPARSAEAYQKIWTEEGSPLLVHSRAFTQAVASRLSGSYEVELGMRYGNPSIPDAITRLRGRGVTHLTALPLYPQYAASSTASSIDEVLRVVRASWDSLPLRILPAFYEQEGFIGAFCQVAGPVLADLAPDHVLFSFHGVPQRQIVKSDPTSGQHCLKSETCCDSVGLHNERCYRAQSFATARALAARLGLSQSGWSVGFQSRLGRTPWIQPFTDVRVDELARQGVKRLAVLCPSFVADCLETLEEIGMRAREQFEAAGGQTLVMVPSLNAHPAWVEAVTQMVLEGAPGEPA